MTTVRFATNADIPALVALGRSMHVESRYGWMVYSADRAWRRLEEMIGRSDCCVMVAVDEIGELCGFLIGTVSEYAFAHDFVAQLDFIYLVPVRRSGLTAMKMLTAFKRWAMNREVAEIVLSNRFGAENEAYVSKLFSRLGMPAVGGVHTMWIERR